MQIDISQQIKKLALSIGFDACGLAPAIPLSDEMKVYQRWLDKGYEAGMQYAHNHLAIRQDIKQLQEGCKTVLVTLTNYYPQQVQDKDLPQIAKYAYGKDYHKVLLKKHRLLLAEIQKIKPCKGRIFVDSAPVLERSHAVRAGLGWIGKSGMLISPALGVHTLISGIALDIEVDTYDKAINRHCGSCTRCIEACPTKAIVAPHIVDANKCISYLSIEHRGTFETSVNLNNAIFGCDKCIDVCPFNKKKAHHIEEFRPKDTALSLSIEDWEKMDENEFAQIFNGTAVKRAKYAGIKRNLQHL